MGQLILVLLRPAAVPGDVGRQLACAALEGHVGEEQLLAVPVRRGDVGCPAGLLVEASVLQAQAAGSSVTDVGDPAAVLARPLRVVALPPSAGPAGPVVTGVHAPGETALAGVDVFRAAGMTATAQALAEVIGPVPASLAGWRRERSAGQAAIAEVDPWTGPRDAVDLTAGALGRQPQRSVRPRSWHQSTTRPICRTRDARVAYSGGVERGAPGRGRTGVELALLSDGWSSPLTASAAWGRRAATLSGSGLIRSFIVQPSTSHSTSRSSKRIVIGVPAHHDDIFPAEISRPASASIRRSSADFQMPRSAARSRRFQCICFLSFLAISSGGSGCRWSGQASLAEAGFESFVGLIPGVLDVVAADVDVARGRRQPQVAQEFLDGLEVHSGLVQRGRAVVPQDVRCHPAGPGWEPVIDLAVQCPAQDVGSGATAAPEVVVESFGGQQRRVGVCPISAVLRADFGQPPFDELVCAVDGRDQARLGSAAAAALAEADVQLAASAQVGRQSRMSSITDSLIRNPSRRHSEAAK